VESVGGILSVYRKDHLTDLEGWGWGAVVDKSIKIV